MAQRHTQDEVAAALERFGHEARKREDAEMWILAGLIHEAVEGGVSVLAAAERLMEQLPVEGRAQAGQAFHRIIDAYCRRVRDAAVNAALHPKEVPAEFKDVLKKGAKL